MDSDTIFFYSKDGKQSDDTVFYWIAILTHAFRNGLNLIIISLIQFVYLSILRPYAYAEASA